MACCGMSLLVVASALVTAASAFRLSMERMAMTAIGGHGLFELHGSAAAGRLMTGHSLSSVDGCGVPG
jgi:hypothetical protein